MAVTYGERAGNDLEQVRRQHDKLKTDVRVAIPGIVVSFDPVAQVASVQPAVRERWRDQHGNLNWVQMPVLLDVAVVFPRAGDFVLTMPLQAGDEVLVIFADMDYSAWWANGGVQNQEDIRRHDLSDAICIPGPWSQPRVIQSYNTTAAELRSLDGTTKVTVKQGEIDITAATVNVNGNLNVSGALDVSESITGGASTLASATIGDKDFGSHIHGGVQTGSGDTGPPA